MKADVAKSTRSHFDEYLSESDCDHDKVSGTHLLWRTCVAMHCDPSC